MSDPTPSTGIALPPGLRSLTADPGAKDDPKRVAELAHQFEALFIGQMLRQMRQSLTMAGDDEEDKSTQPYGAMTDTMDTELAQKLSQDGGLGIADVIIQAFAQQLRDAQRTCRPATSRRGSAGATTP
jgi:Rod binding domain-containing protein